MTSEDTLKLTDGDPLWVLIVAMEYHLDLYERIPEKIIKKRDALLAEAENNIRRQSLELLEGQRRELSRSAYRLSEQIVKNLGASAKMHLDQVNRQGKVILRELREQAVAVPQPQYTPWAYVCLTMSLIAFLTPVFIIFTILIRPDLVDRLSKLL